MVMRRAIACGLFVLIAAALSSEARAQSVDKSKKESRGFTFYESFQGTSNELGQVLKLNTAAGYNWNKYLGFDAGLPVYFISASSTSTSTGGSSHTGLGNIYADVRLTVNNPLLNYQSTLTGTAPTGNESAGFSTGRATYDWNNHFDKTLQGWTPFANLGVANTVSDTHFFMRPFTSLGTVGHFEGGLTRRIIPYVKVGASLYDVLPSGQQKVFSRLVKGGSSTTAGGSSGSSGRSHGAFQSAHETVGTNLTKDNGLTAWISASVGPQVDLEAGYTRSVPYDLNMFSFGIGFNLGSIVKKARGL
jgi:hypothetical protein